MTRYIILYFFLRVKSFLCKFKEINDTLLVKSNNLKYFSILDYLKWGSKPLSPEKLISDSEMYSLRAFRHKVIFIASLEMSCLSFSLSLSSFDKRSSDGLNFSQQFLINIR